MQKKVGVMLCVSLACAMAQIGCGGTVGSSPAVSSSSATALSIAQFGAVGDGRTDNSDAIASTVAAAIQTGASKVELPCGNFLVRKLQPGSPSNRSILFFSSLSHLELTGNGSCTRLFTDLPNVTVVEFDNSSYVSVSNMVLSAVNTAYVEEYGWNGGAAVKFSGVQHGELSTLVIDGSSAAAIILTNRTTNTNVHNNYIHDTQGAAIWEDDCSNQSDKSCGPSSPSRNNLIVSNVILNTAGGAVSAISLDNGSNSTETQVLNNTVSWTSSWTSGPPSQQGPHCIQVNNASDIIVKGNHCDGTPWDGIVITTNASGACQNVSILQNVILNSGVGPLGGSGIVVYNWPENASIGNIVISQNTIQYAAEDGIRLTSGNGAAGITNVSITQNEVDSVDRAHPGTRMGIWANAANSVSISNNTINGNSQYIAFGVRADNATAGVTISTNTISNILGLPVLNNSQ